MPNFEKLSPELVEKGHIKKQRIAILGNYEICEIGNSHELENDSYNPLEVLYIKGNNGVPIPDEEEIQNFLKSKC